MKIVNIIDSFETFQYKILPTKRQILFPCPIGPAVFLKIHAPSSGDCYPKENNQNNTFLSGCYLVPKWAPKL